jgi:hypothetical protein
MQRPVLPSHWRAAWPLFTRLSPTMHRPRARAMMGYRPPELWDPRNRVPFHVGTRTGIATKIPARDGAGGLPI